MRDRLRQIAATLPPVYEIKKVAITGSDLVKQGVTHDRDGKPIQQRHEGVNKKTGRKIIAPRIYYIDKPVQVDHYERLKDAYRRGGDKAVTEYNYNVAKTHADAIAKEQKAKAKELTAPEV